MFFSVIQVELVTQITTITALIIFDLLLFILFRFKQSSKDHVIQVQPRDDIDFVCPYYVNSSDENPLNEFYVIYQVRRSTNSHFAVIILYAIILQISAILIFRLILIWRLFQAGSCMLSNAMYTNLLIYREHASACSKL
jgi:Ephrin